MMDINMDINMDMVTDTEAVTINIHQDQANMDLEVHWDKDALKHTDLTLVDVITTEKEV